jgi:hypothetical protein
MPLRIKFTKFEQYHDGYCTDNDDFINRIVTIIKTIPLFSEADLETYGLEDGNIMKTSCDFFISNKTEIVSFLETCCSGSGYCKAKNVVLDILEIIVTDDYIGCGREEIKIHSSYECKDKIRRFRYDYDSD